MKLPKFLIAFTGHLYLHKYPMWIVYKPNIHRVRGEDVRRVLSRVKPGDILLRRYDGYLSTALTPGFWGHAGIYVGDNNMVHSVGEGCIKEDILNFCRADAVCILRLKIPVENAVEQALRISQLHVDYDYDFDPLNDTYYCTELVDQVCGGVFKDDYRMIAGNLILTPDAVYKSEKVEIKLRIN